jgi:hypothetical protein
METSLIFAMGIPPQKATEPIPDLHYYHVAAVRECIAGAR